MNLRTSRSGKTVHFGACKTSKDCKRYALLEGFVIGKARCLACHYSYEIIIHTDKLGFKAIAGIHSFSMPTQTCLKCDANRIVVTARIK